MKRASVKWDAPDWHDLTISAALQAEWFIDDFNILANIGNMQNEKAAGAFQHSVNQSCDRLMYLNHE